jgi:hypothetical protein
VVVVAAAVVVTLVVVAFKVAGSTLADKSQAVLAPAEVASALVERGSEAGFRALKAQDPAFLRLDVLRAHSLSPVLLTHKFRVQPSEGSRISAFPGFGITS